MSKFQIILTGVFVLFIAVGVGLFATYKAGEQTKALPQITIWGTLPSSLIATMLSDLNLTRETPLYVNYVEKTAGNFDRDFIEALARRQGPDAILLPQELLTRHRDKLVAIPNTIITERDFKNTYIPQAELYITQEKEILALPFTIDPLVMYWNRDLFTNAGIAKPPVFWDEFDTLVTKITRKDVQSNVQRSAISMGEFSNINNAREILGALLLQAGNPVTLRGNANSGGNLVSTIGDGQYNGSESSASAINFFTEFANPREKNYSWHRGLPLSKSWFLSGSLATYFGFSSELFDLRAKNPNIDFDVAPLPQPRSAKNRVTYGTMYGFSIVNSTPDPTATYTILQLLTSSQSLDILSKTSLLPPVRRDMIATGSKDPYQSIFYDSALISRGWLDMNAGRTSDIFQRMVESITSGRSDVYRAIQAAHDELSLSLQNP